MKIILAACTVLFVTDVTANSEWELSSANRANNKSEYLGKVVKDSHGVSSNIMSNVEQSLILQTRFMDSASKERFITRFNKLQGTNYNIKELDRLSELYADRKQMAMEDKSKQAVVVYQYETTEEREEALKQQAIRQQQTINRANSIENEGLDFIKELKNKKQGY